MSERDRLRSKLTKGVDNYLDCWGRWRSSIHLPNKLARFFVLIKSVRVERLKDITNTEAVLEGCNNVDEYFEWWEEMYSGGEFAVDNNPLVWRILFCHR